MPAASHRQKTSTRFLIAHGLEGTLVEIRKRIRKDNPSAAEWMRLRIIKVVKLLGAMPGIGHRGRREDTMEFVITPYILVYRVMRSEIRILGIFHGHRDEWEDFSDGE